MKKWILFLTIFAFLAVSCKKKVTISGRVYNPVTNEGISGVKVTLSKQKTGIPGSVDGSGAKIIASGLTDINGKIMEKGIYAEAVKKTFTLPNGFYYFHWLFYGKINVQKIVVL